MLGTRNTRDHHSKRPKEIRKRSSISYAESLQPMVRSSSIAVIEMSANEPKELVESLRPAGVRIQVPIHLGEKIIENDREAGSRGTFSNDVFHDNFWRGRSQPRIHVSAARPLTHSSLHKTRISGRVHLILLLSCCTASVLLAAHLKGMGTTRSTLRTSIAM